MNFLHTTAMDRSCKGICGLAASLELKYVLVVPTEQATMLHGELLMRGVPEQLIYEVDPNRRPRPQKSTNCGPAAEASGSGGRTRAQEKRFMPGSIRLGTYAAGGQQYNVGLRCGSMWISMIDRAPGADGGGASEVTVADGGGASEVSPVVGSSRTAEVSPVVDRGVAVVPVPKEDSCITMNMPMESDGGHETDDENITVLGGDCENDNNEPNLDSGSRRCNSSSMLCEDCKQWLLKEYFGDRLQDEASDLDGRHACIYRQIVDRLFVVTVTESGGAGDDEDEDDDEDRTACCEITTADDGVVERPSTATDRTTTKVACPPEREQPFTRPTTPSQPAPPMEHSTTPSVPGSSGKEDQADHAAENVGKPKSKKNTFFGKFCKSNKKTKKNLKPPKTN